MPDNSARQAQGRHEFPLSPGALPGRVADGGDQQPDIAGVQAGGGIAEIDTDASSDARRGCQDAALPG
jgi:hypothetical protein